MSDLVPTWVIGSVDLTEYPYSVDRDNTVDIGEPEMVVEGIASNLADGDLERVVRHGNRAYVIPVYVEGPTLADVADAEAVLRAELRRTGLTLTHNPGDSWAVDSVYEIQTARMTPARDDVHEAHLIRKFTLTLTCSPWARSANPVTVAALGPPSVTPVVATITDCTTTTGWTGSLSYLDLSDPLDSSRYSTVTVVDLGADGVSASGDGYRLTIEHAPASPVALTGTPYLSLTMSGTSPTKFILIYAGGGPDSFVTVSPVRTVALPGGLMQYVLPANPAKSLQSVYIETFVSSGGYLDNTALTLRVFDVSRTDTLPQVSARQQTRVLEVSGTERTPASIRVESQDGATDLGLTLVHTCPEDGSGYAPAMRRWRTQGNGTPTASVNTFSGAYEPIHPQSFEAQVATAALPAGGYQLVAVMACSSISTRVISWSTGTIPPGSVTREGLVEGSQVVEFTAANTWQLVPLGDPLSLPSVRTAAGLVQVGLLRDSPSNGALPTVQLDELWLFRVDDDCHLSVVDCDEPNLWLDSPDVASGVPTTWIGGSSSARRHPGLRLKAQGNHHLLAGGTALFTATRNTDNAKASATFFDRYHSNAAT